MKTTTPNYLSVLIFNAFKDDTPLPAKLAALNDDTLTVHIMNTMIETGKNISTVAIELAENMAMFSAAVAMGIKDEESKIKFREISDLISSIRWTDDDDIFVKIQEKVKPYNANKEYCHLANQILTILHTGYIF